ncbi:hypothetical protein [Pseudonocardia abyssalis]|uniref:XRE family transcriptional regulator n=1 Tax=Pseudonocardia abyssalis TaxID=2792008 RepID=A0ABS6UXQ3_9PSEU|nr:hypothetical protein [Pseudonocardia abyssalis]MBW0117638.1 hypothetical protein [Pseudonocardia abyssalis]MBW0136484.1 hypothetical protein [Pseudonocardia abyssalis]
MTGPTGPGDVPVMLNQLIRNRMAEHGWSYTDLENRSAHALTRGRWQQLGSGTPQKRFPDPASLTVIATVLDVDITTVVLAAARAVGLDVRSQASALAALLPEGTERLPDVMRDAILALVRAAVADSAQDRDGAVPAARAADTAVDWPKSAAPSRRRHNGPTGEPRADSR